MDMRPDTGNSGQIPDMAVENRRQTTYRADELQFPMLEISGQPNLRA
jgi:hypothetical protein